MERVRVYENKATDKLFCAVWRSALDGKVWARILITNKINGEQQDFGKFATKKQANKFIEKHFLGV